MNLKVTLVKVENEQFPRFLFMFNYPLFFELLFYLFYFDQLRDDNGKEKTI